MVNFIRSDWLYSRNQSFSGGAGKRIRPAEWITRYGTVRARNLNSTEQTPHTATTTPPPNNHSQSGRLRKEKVPIRLVSIKRTSLYWVIVVYTVRALFRYRCPH